MARRLAVRPGEETGEFTPLIERQPITATPYATMALTVPKGSITANQIAAGSIGSSQLAPGAVTATNLAPGSVGGEALAPDAALNNLLRSGQSGVASGGVILSELASAPDLMSAGYSKLSEQPIELSPEKWEALGTAPLMPGAMASGRRRDHTVVWTGTEYIIWGGITYDAETPVNTSLRFNPTTGNWTATSAVGAPIHVTGFVLEESADLANPASWASAAGFAQDTATEHTVIVPTVNTIRAYRLRRD